MPDKNEEKINRKPLNAHRRIVHNLFKSAKKAKEIYIRIENIPEPYTTGGNEVGESNGSGDLVHVSILTDDILDYDKKVFGYFNENKDRVNEMKLSGRIGYVDTKKLGDGFENLNTDYISYKPYFLEFQIERSALSASHIKFLENNEITGHWVYGSLLEKKDKNVNDDGSIIIDGNLLSSASPVRYTKGHLKITNKKVGIAFTSDVISTYSTTASVKTEAVIKGELKKVLDGAEDYTIKLYDVGDGNCIYGYTDNDKRFLFDIGYNMCQTLSYEIPTTKLTRHVYTERALRAVKPNVVMLSHWDLDHILGVVYANSKIFNVAWIAPDLNPIIKTNINSHRLAKYLEALGVLFLLDSGIIDTDIYSNGNLTVWKCKGKKTPRPGTGYNNLSEPNNSGLAIEIKINSTKGQVLTLLPGDAEYLALPKNMNFSTQNYDYLVVPHHGSNIDTSHLCKGAAGSKDAIISASGRNKKHPCANHMNELTASGYNYEILGHYKYALIKSTSISKMLEYK